MYKIKLFFLTYSFLVIIQIPIKNKFYYRVKAARASKKELKGKYTNEINYLMKL